MYQTAIVFTGATVLSCLWSAVVALILYDTAQLLTRSDESGCKRYTRPSDKDKTENKDE